MPVTALPTTKPTHISSQAPPPGLCIIVAISHIRNSAIASPTAHSHTRRRAIFVSPYACRNMRHLLYVATNSPPAPVAELAPVVAVGRRPYAAVGQVARIAPLLGG